MSKQTASGAILMLAIGLATMAYAGETELACQIQFDRQEGLTSAISKSSAQGKDTCLEASTPGWENGEDGEYVQIRPALRKGDLVFAHARLRMTSFEKIKAEGLDLHLPVKLHYELDAMVKIGSKDTIVIQGLPNRESVRIGVECTEGSPYDLSGPGPWAL